MFFIWSWDYVIGLFKNKKQNTEAFFRAQNSNLYCIKCVTWKLKSRQTVNFLEGITFYFKVYLLFVVLNVLLMAHHVCTCAWGARSGWDPLGMESQAVLTLDVGAGAWTSVHRKWNWVLWKKFSVLSPTCFLRGKILPWCSVPPSETSLLTFWLSSSGIWLHVEYWDKLFCTLCPASYPASLWL